MEFALTPIECPLVQKPCAGRVFFQAGPLQSNRINPLEGYTAVDGCNRCYFIHYFICALVAHRIAHLCCDVTYNFPVAPRLSRRSDCSADSLPPPFGIRG